jgi:hypothetical protein
MRGELWSVGKRGDAEGDSGEDSPRSGRPQRVARRYSSTEIPAERIKLRNVPLATSLWSGTERVAGVVLAHENDVAASPADACPAKGFEYLDNIPAADSRQFCHQAITST